MPARAMMTAPVDRWMGVASMPVHETRFARVDRAVVD